MPTTIDAAQAAHQLIAAFEAVNNGTADDTQRTLRSATLNALAGNLDDDAVVSIVSAAVGPFADVYEAPYEELSPIRRWVRDSASEADRATPAFGDMESVYEALIAASDSSGPALRLGTGVNLVGLDRENRRWLIPRVATSALSEALSAGSRQDARASLRRKGAVMFHWSIERTHLVPDPSDAAGLLPLPDGGKYLVVYQGSPQIVTKPRFRDALTTLASSTAVCDLLVWDTSEQPSTLWSLRGHLGHAAGDDIAAWPAPLIEAATSLRDQVWP
jgi:hypothetical protein